MWHLDVPEHDPDSNYPEPTAKRILYGEEARRDLERLVRQLGIASYVPPLYRQWEKNGGKHERHKAPIYGKAALIIRKCVKEFVKIGRRPSAPQKSLVTRGFLLCLSLRMRAWGPYFGPKLGLAEGVETRKTDYPYGG